MSDRSKASLLICIGFSVHTIGLFALIHAGERSVMTMLWEVFMLGASLAFVVGCIFYAREKGWHGWVGGVLGIFSLVGLYVIWRLPVIPRPHRRDSGDPAEDL